MRALQLTFCGVPFFLLDLCLLEKGHSKSECLYNHVKKGSLFGKRILDTSLTSAMLWHLGWGYMQGIIRNIFPASITLVWKMLVCRKSKVRNVSTSLSSHRSNEMLSMEEDSHMTKFFFNNMHYDGTSPTKMLQGGFYCGRSSTFITWAEFKGLSEKFFTVILIIKVSTRSTWPAQHHVCSVM